MVADTAYFTLYKDSFKLIASKKITLMKERSSLPSADTRILPEILASHKDAVLYLAPHTPGGLQVVMVDLVDSIWSPSGFHKIVILLLNFLEST